MLSPNEKYLFDSIDSLRKEVEDLKESIEYIKSNYQRKPNLKGSAYDLSTQPSKNRGRGPYEPVRPRRP